MTQHFSPTILIHNSSSNAAEGVGSSTTPLFIFKSYGKAIEERFFFFGYLTNKELNVAIVNVLINCGEVQPSIE